MLKTKIFVFMLLLGLGLTGQISAQQRSIQGTVVDRQGSPLPGVTVVIKGTTQGTVTNAGGNYSLAGITSDATLVFSFVGMRTQEVVVGNRTDISITMVEETIGLEEVVAVGYGVQKKVNLTGSVGVIDNEKLENRPVTRLEQALQGQVSGLKVVQFSAQPGKESITMQIRGQSTFTNNPILTIIDGIPSSITRINPNDIESISVLKDASSASIYGARAAGGVILITTKTGKPGKPRIRYDSYIGIQQPTRIPERVSALEHATLFKEAELNDNPNTTVHRFTEQDFARFSSPDWKDHDWLGAVYSEALQTHHNFSISGGSENQDYFLSVGYLFQDGIVINTGYEKYNMLYNQNIRLTERLKLNFKSSFSPTQITAPSEANYPGGPPRGLTNVINRAWRWGSYVPIYTENGDWAYVEGIEPSPIGLASKDGGQQIIKGKRISGNFNLEYDIVDNLKMSGMYGFDWSQNRQSEYSTKMKFYNPVNPEVVQYEVNQNVLLVQNSSDIYQKTQFLLNYDKIIGNHTFSALAGYTREWYYQDNETVGRRDFLTDNIYAISAGSSDPITWTTSGSISDWALASYIGRINYSYQNKYLAEASMRYDGSSRFIKDIRWGFFPALSAGWRITEESFLKDNNFLTYLKIRASWGQVGNQNVGNYPFASTLSTTNYYFNGSPQRAVFTTGSPSPELTWESKTGINLGFDGNIKGELLSFAFDIFKERTSDILLTVPLPTTYGKGEPVQNAGIVENNGWELEVAHKKTFRDFSYGITFQISDATNKVIDLSGTGPWITGNTITEEGNSMYDWYGYKAIGFFQSNDEVQNHSFQHARASEGDIKYQENGGDPKRINADDRIRLGRSDPRFPYGLNVNINYKNFDLIAFGQGVMDHKVFDSGWTAYNFDRAYSSLFKYHLDRWTPETPNARFPKTRIGGGINNQFSSFWLQNAAYFRMKNLQIGYTLPQEMLSKINMERIRIYISGENLFTFTKLLGYDPEIPLGTGNRIVENRYVPAKNYLFGINVNF
jgi:TonB-dependent starch-binding outer membrane protein SusC